MTEPTTAEYVQILADDSKSLDERMCAMGALKVASMQGDRFDPHRSDYMTALRVAAEAEHEELRLTAIKVLCVRKDRPIQKRLIEGLEDPSKELAKPAKALQFLSYDVHAGVFPIARKYADNPPDDVTQHEAMRLLGSDTDSVDLFAKILEDPSEDFEARSLASNCLSGLDADRYVGAAKTILANASDNEDLRTELAIGLLRKDTDPEDEELHLLAKSIVEDDAANASLRRSAKSLLARTPGPADDPDGEPETGIA